MAPGSLVKFHWSMMLPRRLMVVMRTELVEVSIGEGNGAYWENRSEVLTEGRIETYPTDWLELVSESPQNGSEKA
jgi:hypothetical protein